MINELARRSTPGRGSSCRSRVPTRRDYLQKAIAAYRRTLAIDSEDVGAHWGLAQAYSDPAWGDESDDRVAR